MATTITARDGDTIRVSPIQDGITGRTTGGAQLRITTHHGSLLFLHLSAAQTTDLQAALAAAAETTLRTGEPMTTPTDTSPAEARAGLVTDREREVLRYVAEGLTNGEIGTRLGLTEDTIKTHMRRAMKKLGARSRAHVVVIAIRRGIIRLKPWPTGE